MNAEKKESGWLKALFLGCLVVGSVVVFALGVMVGRNVQLPSEGFQGTPATTSAGQARKSATSGPALREEIALPQKKVEVKSEEMTFYDTLSSTARPGTAPAPVVVSAAPALPPTEPPSTAPAGTTAAAAKGEASPVTPPAATQETAAAQKALPVGVGRYAMQVMATRDREEADQTVVKLGQSGFTAYVLSKKANKGMLHAVRVGKVATEAEARKIQAELKARTRFKDAFLVKE